MPCDTRSEASVKLDKADWKMVTAAMEKLGYYAGQWSMNADGRLNIRGERSSEELTSRIKREVTRQTVIAQAKRFGWGLKEDSNGKLLLQKARL